MREFDYEPKNIAYTDEYKASFNRQCNIIFQPQNFDSEEQKELTKGYILKSDEYTAKVDTFRLNGAKNHLYYKNKFIFEYDSINDNHLCKIVTYRNGIDYLFYGKDLYGYSTLNLSTMEQYQYYPDESIENGETFIWCNVFYNSKNDIIAVEGCYWACPYSVFLYELNDPLNMFSKQINTFYLLKNSYNNYIGFVNWIDNQLILKLEFNHSKKEEIITIKEAEYYKFMR